MTKKFHSRIFSLFSFLISLLLRFLSFVSIHSFIRRFKKKNWKLLRFFINLFVISKYNIPRAPILLFIFILLLSVERRSSSWTDIICHYRNRRGVARDADDLDLQAARRAPNYPWKTFAILSPLQSIDLFHYRFPTMYVSLQCINWNSFRLSRIRRKNSELLHFTLQFNLGSESNFLNLRRL